MAAAVTHAAVTYIISHLPPGCFVLGVRLSVVGAALRDRQAGTNNTQPLPLRTGSCCCPQPLNPPPDEDLLGCLTERDPATFYAIMDLLVRKVHPDSLT